jgi:hypothetical protein
MPFLTSSGFSIGSIKSLSPQDIPDRPEYLKPRYLILSKTLTDSSNPKS